MAFNAEISKLSISNTGDCEYPPALLEKIVMTTMDTTTSSIPSL
ncbi:hypothetical protein SAMN05428947_113143 [Mucilaginibacter sp. OK283]|nr:hypothetical protein SAMN05428947_113143 [Mucilaginibacter sp. OK283]